MARRLCGLRRDPVLVSLPLHAFVLPSIGTVKPDAKPSGDTPEAPALQTRAGARRNRALLLLATVLTLGAVTASMIGVHLLTFLQARGLELAAAVALGALVGPSQVAARVVEMALGRHYHPIWTMVASVALVGGGVILLVVGFPILALALALYGAGNGIAPSPRGRCRSRCSVPSGTRRSWASWPCRACSPKPCRHQSERS